MIRVVTSRRWSTLNTRANEAEAELTGTRERADSLQVELSSTSKELHNVREVSERAHVAWGCAEAASIKAGRQVDQLLAEAAEPKLVFVLTRLGEIHSVHASHAAGKKAAEDAGAPPAHWTSIAPGTPVSECAWRLTPMWLRPEGES